MQREFPMKAIAHVRSDFSSKFGVPRQSGLVAALEATVVFAPEYRNPDALRGLEGFSHIWLVWVFDQNKHSSWHTQVRVPVPAEKDHYSILPPVRPTGPTLSV